MCHWITPVANEVALLILQHPLEQHQAKGSARLLQLSLPHSRLVVGEHFEPALLQAGPKAAVRYSLLLYPADPPGSDPALQTPAALDPAWLQHPTQLQLVVLDATWRKSRKMLYLHPWLQRLPRLSLAAPPPSLYAIRKAERPTQRSTLEATCQALQQLEGNDTRYQRLLQAFAGFVAQQQAWADAASITRA
jgi:DTW domain-containing protein YfiP